MTKPTKQKRRAIEIISQDLIARKDAIESPALFPLVRESLFTIKGIKIIGMGDLENGSWVTVLDRTTNAPATAIFTLKPLSETYGVKSNFSYRVAVKTFENGIVKEGESDYFDMFAEKLAEKKEPLTDIEQAISMVIGNGFYGDQWVEEYSLISATLVGVADNTTSGYMGFLGSVRSMFVTNEEVKSGMNLLVLCDLDEQVRPGKGNFEFTALFNQYRLRTNFHVFSDEFVAMLKDYHGSCITHTNPEVYPWIGFRDFFGHFDYRSPRCILTDLFTKYQEINDEESSGHYIN